MGHRHAARIGQRRNSPEVWIGNAVAEQLNLDTDKPGDKAKAKAIAKKWISTGSLKVAEIRDSRSGRDVPCVVVGEWVNWEEG